MLDLEWLLSPYETKVFVNEVWQRKPKLLVTGRPGYFESLFSKQALERIIEFAQPQPPNIRLVSVKASARVEVPFSPNGRINIDRIRKLYVEGRTVIINAIENLDPNVAQLTRSMEAETGASVWVNAYLTPRAEQGFRPHYDNHDVFVAQIHGEKLWKVYGGQSVRPLNELVENGEQDQPPTQVPEEFHLTSGDLLYIPRGWIHEAITQQSDSLHLTFGVRPCQGIDLMTTALKLLITRHPEFREALPMGRLGTAEHQEFLKERFAQLTDLLVNHASVVDIADALDDEWLRRGRSGGDGHLFEETEFLLNLNTDSILQRRVNVPCRVRKRDNSIVGLHFLNGMIKGPIAFESAMNFVSLSTKPFRVAELPGLSKDHQLAFATSLITDGLCYVIDVCRANGIGEQAAAGESMVPGQSGSGT
jgi:ribosomal protein L16 Arg81 hydroxylase